ncbi:putative sugar-binding periplasmic protein precursor [Pseudovibrio axinellae]|uniref:Probable sugar-binding periplasmic protein n=1 Tax=Pseudovibrio axinellae TaxID=989403 RepID=A0A165XPH6_9HYPH|nr:ABC transporter substrate-binding protein [Pseudovibrio axinellae]KZL17917.1 putative sugar-binding periplasmic protein precursor [Pseudovibrio axinellae]SER57920.1 carbohydrate ABC transporter substrate-binding protein, CUT1 family [Pseudovibrio axinellae]
MKGLNALLVTAALLASTTFTQAADLEVTHWWTSGGEAAAVRVFADAVNNSGHTWVDSAIAGGDNARPVIISRISGGDPMQATQLNTGRDAEDLIRAGLMTDLTEVAEKEGWADIIRPAKLLDSCRYEGRIYCVPVNIHSFQWMWLNRKVYEQNGLAVPTNWSEFVQSAPTLRDKGITPLAVGGEPWQLSGMSGVFQVAVGGVDLYRKIKAQKSVEAASGPEMRKVFQAFADARDLGDNGHVGRAWNNATSMVITGKAAAQIMGDWAQGEFSMAEQVAGKDYDCLPGLGMNPVLDTGGDSFFFPKPVGDQPDVVKAQLEMASLLVSKAVQVDFNLKKGSLPVRGDVDLNAANSCMKKGIAILSDPENILPATEQSFSSDTQGQLEDLWVEFFNAPEMTVDEAQARYAQIIEFAD